MFKTIRDVFIIIRVVTKYKSLVKVGSCKDVMNQNLYSLLAPMYSLLYLWNKNKLNYVENFECANNHLFNPFYLQSLKTVQLVFSLLYKSDI